MAIKKKTNNKLLFFGKIVRNDDLKIFIKVNKEIEDFYKHMSDDTKHQSTSWVENPNNRHGYYSNSLYSEEFKQFLRLLNV